MVSSFLFGTAVLRFFGIGVSAFQIAGGLLLGASGLSMLHTDGPSGASEKKVDTSRINPGLITSTAIVPISLPLTTGAGTMSTITVYADAVTSVSQRIELLAAILVRTVLIKVMGLFTLAIGIQFIVTGCSTILEHMPLQLAR